MDRDADDLTLEREAGPFFKPNSPHNRELHADALDGEVRGHPGRSDASAIDQNIKTSCPTDRTTRNSARLANKLPQVVMMKAAGSDQLPPAAAMPIATNIPWEGKAGMKRSANPAANKPISP